MAAAAGDWLSDATKAHTVNTQTFTLVREVTTTIVPAKVTLKPTKKTSATLTPNTDLIRGASYIATITGGSSRNEEETEQPNGP